MRQELTPKIAGDWFFSFTKPIGSWCFCVKILYDDRFHSESELFDSWQEISDAEKVAKEEEQEEWRKEQEPMRGVQGGGERDSK